MPSTHEQLPTAPTPPAYQGHPGGLRLRGLLKSPQLKKLNSTKNHDTILHRRDLHPDLRADYVLANPPFNDSDWFRQDDDMRWQFGVPPKGNASDCRVQKFSRVINLRTHPCPTVKH